MDKHTDRKICSLHKITKAACLLILAISLSIVPFAFGTSVPYVPNDSALSNEQTDSSAENSEKDGAESNQDAVSGESTVSPAENSEETDTENTQDVVDESSEDTDKHSSDENNEPSEDDAHTVDIVDKHPDRDINENTYIEYIEPTCTSAGTKTWRCNSCEAIRRQEVIPALGHAFGSESECKFTWADDYSSATVKITCTRCQEIYFEDDNTSNVKISSTTSTDDESKTTTTTYTAEYIFKYDPDDEAVKTFEDKQEVTTPSDGEGEGGGQTGGDGDKTDDGDQTGSDDKTDKDNKTEPSSDYYAPETPTVQAPFTGAVAIESPIKGFTAHIEGAPAGNIAMAVNQVASGPAFEALMNTIAARFSSVNGQTFDIAGVFDVNLSIENKNMTEEFGTLTLEFPINSKFNGRTAYIFHCHGVPGNITSFTPVTVMNGKVIVGGITQLSTFAVAIADNPLEIPVGTVVQLPSSPVQTTAVPQEESSGIRHIEPISNDGLSPYKSIVAEETPIWRTYDSGISVMIVRFILISIAGAAILTMIILARREKHADKI